MVTHDRDLIASFATRLWVFRDDGLIDFWGDYESYLEKHGDKPEKKKRTSMPPRQTSPSA